MLQEGTGTWPARRGAAHFPGVMLQSLSEGWASGKHLPHHSLSRLEASTDISLPAGTMTLYFQVITRLEG